MQKKSFTLVELMIVIAILAILSAIVIFALNPVEVFKQFKDSNRITQLKMLEKSIIMFDVDSPNDSVGTIKVVYTSLPDSSSTCNSYSLPTLPSGYTYNCVTSANYRKTNGTGWVPIDFDKMVYLKMPQLPIDPVNDASYYYTYIMGGSFELTARLEALKNTFMGNSGLSVNDGGDINSLYEVGNDLKLMPKIIRVLSIYPHNGSCKIATVVTRDGMNLADTKFNVNCITTNAFNSGGYNLNNYDVVILDPEDCWNRPFDAEETTNLRNYVYNGGSLIATHDTICCGCYTPRTLYAIRDIFGLNCGGSDFSFSSVNRTKIGNITSNPYNLASSFSVLSTHAECGGMTLLGIERYYEATADNLNSDLYLGTYRYGKGKTIKTAYGHTSAAPAAGSEESKSIINMLYWAGVATE